MRVLLLYLLVFAPAFAAEITFTPTVPAATLEHNSAVLEWTNAGADTSASIAWSTKASFDLNGTFDHEINPHDEIVNNGTIRRIIMGLKPSTTYTACVIAERSNGDATICTSSGNAANRVEFTTAALPSPHPVVPELPASFDTSYPGSFAATLTAMSDCSDFSDLLDDAYGAMYSGQNVKVVVPSDRHADDGENTCTDPGVPTTKTGGGNVVIASDDEDQLPVGVRVTLEAHEAGYLTTIKSTSSTVPALSISGDAPRLVGIRVAPPLGPEEGDGDPRLYGYLVKFDGGVDGLICDRCIFDGIGYPYRVQHAFYGKGSNVAVIDSYYNQMEIWIPWIGTTSVTHPNQQTLSVAEFDIGLGGHTATIPAFSAVFNGTTGTGTAKLYIDTTDDSVHLLYSSGSPVSSCTGLTCTADATLTVPRTGLLLHGDDTFAYTSGKFLTGGGTPTPSLWSNTPMDVITNPSGNRQGGEWMSFGFELDGSGGTDFGNHKLFNTFVGVTGIGVFINSDYTMNFHDIDVYRNTFQSNGDGFHVATPTTSSGPFMLFRRHHAEFKQGNIVRIAANHFTGGFIGVSNNDGAVIKLKRDLVGGPSNPARDFTIKDNWYDLEPNCHYIATDSGQGKGSTTDVIRNVWIENNLCVTHGTERRAWYIGATLASGGYFMLADQGALDLTLKRNTHLGYGESPAFLLTTDRCGEGLNATGNLVLFQESLVHAKYRGAFNASGFFIWPDATPSCTVTANNDGTTALDAAFPDGGYSAPDNLFVMGCEVPSTCTDATGTSDLLGNECADYPSDSECIYEPTTLGARLDLVLPSRGDTDYTVAPAYTGKGADYPALLAALAGEAPPAATPRSGGKISSLGKRATH